MLGNCFKHRDQTLKQRKVAEILKLCKNQLTNTKRKNYFLSTVYSILERVE